MEMREIRSLVRLAAIVYMAIYPVTAAKSAKLWYNIATVVAVTVVARGEDHEIL